jgi:hypothetical protein
MRHQQQAVAVPVVVAVAWYAAYCAICQHTTCAIQHTDNVTCVLAVLCTVHYKQDGHIKLADMGGVAEFAQGTCLDQQDPASSCTPYRTEIGSMPKLEPASAVLKNNHRRRSIMG